MEGRDENTNKNNAFGVEQKISTDFSYFLFYDELLLILKLFNVKNPLHIKDVNFIW